MKTQDTRKRLSIGVGLGLGAAASYVLLTRLKAPSTSIEIHKSLDIEARVDRVFDFWTDYENFPDWMAHVRAVHDIDGVRSHWTVTGPAGLSVEWDAVLTEVTPNKMLSWRTLPTSHVKHEGTVQFSKNPDGRAHVDVSLTYWPPAGTLGHMAAQMMGADPGSQMDEDLIRMKSLLETGTPSYDPDSLQDELDSAAESGAA